MHRFDLRCAPSLLCLVLATGSLAAQGTQKPDESPVPATQAAFPTVSIQFRGGTLRDYLEALRATGDHNIVIPERAERVVVPPLTLKAVSLANAIEIVAKTTDRERFSVAMTRLEGRGNPVYAVQVEERQRNPASARDGNASLTATPGTPCIP